MRGASPPAGPQPARANGSAPENWNSATQATTAPDTNKASARSSARGRTLITSRNHPTANRGRKRAAGEKKLPKEAEAPTPPSQAASEIRNSPGSLRQPTKHWRPATAQPVQTTIPSSTSFG